MNNKRRDVLLVMRASLIFKDVPLRYGLEIIEAHTCIEYWDFYSQSDGLTFFIDRIWKNNFPSVFVWHDWKMQNRDRLRGDKDVDTYVRDINLELKQLMYLYDYSRWKVFWYPILATLSWKIFKR